MRKHWSDRDIFIVLVLLAIITRFFTFFNCVLDWDESTYLVIGQQLWNGQILYQDLIDLKPPVGLWLFALMTKVFGTCIPLYRLFLAVLIGGMSFLLFKIYSLLGGGRKGALFTSVLFIIINLFHSALSFNLEHWMNLFTITGFFLFLKLRSPWKYILSGLFIGISFSVKYLSLIDFFALAAIITYSHYNKYSGFKIVKLLKSIIYAGLAFSTPFLLVNAFFYLRGNWEAFYFITYVAPGNYSSSVSLLTRLDSVWHIHVNYIAYFVLFYFALFSKSVSRNIKFLSVVWLISSVVATQLTGQFFRHYAMQFYAPLCLLSGAILESKSTFIDRVNTLFFTVKTQRYILGFICVFTLVFNYFDYYLEKDPMAKVIDYLDDNMAEDETFLPLNCGAVVLFDRNIMPSHPYVHSSLLFRDVHIRTLEIDVPKVINQLIDKPTDYILFQDNTLRNDLMDKFINENYELVHEFQRKVNLYKYKSVDLQQKMESEFRALF